MKKTFRVPKPTEQTTETAPAGQPAEKETTRTDTKTGREKLAEEIKSRPITEDDLKTLSESQRAGVQAGNIKASWDYVEVSDKASPTGKGALRAYIRLEAQNAAGLSQMFDGKINPATPKPETGEDNRTPEQKQAGACDYANYGADLERRANARQLLMGELEGPEKLIKRAVVGLLAIGEEPASIRQMIMNGKFKGTPGLEKLIDAALRS